MLLAVTGFFPYTFVYAEEQAIRHEVRAELQWVSDEYWYDNYIVNQEPAPEAKGNFTKKYLGITSSYAFFFTPLREDRKTPIALQRFYSHPTMLSVNFFCQPEEETTYTHQNPPTNYFSSSYRDERSRSAGLDIHYYIQRNTGLIFHLRSTKNEENFRKLNSFGLRGTGENNEIQRYYGFGVSQYIFDNLNISLLYTALDFKHRENEKTWTDDDPLQVANYFTSTDTIGKTVTLTGEYVFRKFLGVKGVYEFWDQEAHSKVLPVYSDKSPIVESYHDDDVTNHVLETVLSLYLGEKTTVRAAGSYATQKLSRIYDTVQAVEYDWVMKTVKVNLLRYLNRSIGIQIGYEFTRQDGDIIIESSGSENNLQTTYTAKADFHSLSIGIIGRF